MGWGYYRIYPELKTARTNSQGQPVANTPAEQVRSEYRTNGAEYLLVGCEPHRMFRPGHEPPGFRWWWWDNSMMPHLRYVNASNPKGEKWWSRITYCGWSMPHTAQAEQSHRTRINTRLAQLSDGAITEIADIWGGCVATRPVHRKHALVCASSERNHREFYGEDRRTWIDRVTSRLNSLGYTWHVRDKVGVKQRKINQTTDELIRGEYDLMVANHSACASEGVIHGVPVVLTSSWNGAWTVATPWEYFAQQGQYHTYTQEQINTWVTKICAYTYHREELMSNEWIKLHPQAGHLR